jgi:hypothetical protein
MSAHDQLRRDTRAAIRPGLLAFAFTAVVFILVWFANVLVEPHGEVAQNLGRAAVVVLIASAVVTAVRLQRVRCPSCDAHLANSMYVTWLFARQRIRANHCPHCGVDWRR